MVHIYTNTKWSQQCSYHSVVASSFCRCSKQEMSSLVLWLLVTLVSSLDASQNTSSDGIVMTEVTSIAPLTIGMFIILLLIFLEHAIKR